MAVSKNENMRRIRSKNTGPELVVRRGLRELGYVGYRLHRRDLPGKPDVVFIGRRKALLVHGCFWHGHSCKEGSRCPKTNIDYWRRKIGGNQRRDSMHVQMLIDSGWSVLTVWECETSDTRSLLMKLNEFMLSALR